MQTVCYFAKQELAIWKYESFVELLELTGSDVSALQSGYPSRKTANGLISAISDCIDADVCKYIMESVFLSISCDKTNDISNTGKLTVYVKDVDNTLPTKSYFLSDYDITDKTANGIIDKLKDCFSEFGIDMLKVKALVLDHFGCSK